MSRKIYYCVSIMVSLGLSTVLLWALVSIHDPEARLLKLDFVPDVIDNETTVASVELEVINRNFFRGFDYSSTGGYVELFYVSQDSWWQLGWTDTPLVVQHFDSTLRWPLTVDIWTDEEEWKETCRNLTSQTGRIYVSLSLSYWYKILMWTTETNYYQWLEAEVYLDNNLDFNRVEKFQRTKDFSVALST